MSRPSRRPRRRRRLRHQAPRRDQAHRRSRGRLAGRPRAREAARRSPRSTASRTSTTDLADSPRAGRRRRGDPVHSDADARRADASSACRPASTCRWRSPWPTTSPTPRRGGAAAADRPGRHGADTRAGSTPATSGCTRGSPPASSTSSRWTCRPTSSAARTSTRWASRARGPTTCCGTTPPTPWTCSPTRRGSPIVRANAIQGPIHPELGIAMDMSIQLKAETGAICTLSLSFNNDGPLGTFFRYIGDTGTYIARYDDLVNGKEEQIDVSRRRRVDERHRAAGPRVLRRDPRGPRAERRVAQVCRATAPSRSSRSSWTSSRSCGADDAHRQPLTAHRGLRGRLPRPGLHESQPRVRHTARARGG